MRNTITALIFTVIPGFFISLEDHKTIEFEHELYLETVIPTSQIREEMPVTKTIYKIENGLSELDNKIKKVEDSSKNNK